MPRVSVIIPTYNCEAFIEEAVLSICRQTERDLEILVVDDGSTDCTPAIVQELAASDPRIVVKSEEHSGKAGTARNAGLACASGEYVAFLDGDDICDPERIARELAVLERFPEVDVVFHDYKKFSSDPRTDSAHSHFESLDLKNRARRHLTSVGASTYLCTEDFYTFLSLEAPVVWTCTVMLRRHLLDGEIGWFREDLTIGEDYDFWLRLALERRLALIDEVLSYYRKRPGSLTENSERMWREGIVLHVDNLRRGVSVFSRSEMKKYQKKIGSYWFHLGVWYLRNGQPAEARSAYARSLALAPRPKTVAAYCKTLAPRWVARAYRRYSGG
jgi:glycosyltransferase involved in cell wall biosynthesis